MPLHPNVRRCTHIQITGHRCGSPALKQEYFCYFHTRMIKGVQTRVDSQIHPVALIESAEAIQAALMHTIDAVLKGTMDNKRANIVLKALYIAVRNSRNLYFHLRQDDMVREVPNYAQQYLTEHPEQNSPTPAQANPTARRTSSRKKLVILRKRRPARSEGLPTKDLCTPRLTSPAPNKKPSHPERARKRESKDPHQANSRNAATGNSNHQPERNRENPGTENIPPLTTHQSQRWHEIKKLEACIEGARRGNWRDLRTVFNAVGLTPQPSKPNCHSERSEGQHTNRKG